MSPKNILDKLRNIKTSTSIYIKMAKDDTNAIENKE